MIPAAREILITKCLNGTKVSLSVLNEYMSIPVN